jgi:hypothetical protein
MTGGAGVTPFIFGGGGAGVTPFIFGGVARAGAKNEAMTPSTPAILDSRDDARRADLLAERIKDWKRIAEA